MCAFARGAAWRVRVCDCNEGPLAEDHWVCTINNEGALKKKSLSKKIKSALVAVDHQSKAPPDQPGCRPQQGQSYLPIQNVRNLNLP